MDTLVWGEGPGEFFSGSPAPLPEGGASVERLLRVEVLHIGADYPPPIPDDPSAQSVSDHDALVVVFSLE